MNMNRILVVIIVILIPVTIVTNKKESSTLVYAETLEKINLEIPVVDESIKDDLESNQNANITEEDTSNKVLISNNKDKSNPYYIDLEEYVIGVVAGEMPASFHIEALKAQAIASRTFAMYKMSKVNDYVLSTTINDQVYLTIDEMKSKWGNDFQLYYEKVKSAVEATKGQVITYNDDLIISYYFAISNGYTDNAINVFKENRDYLVSVESKWDKNYSSYSSTRSILKSNFCSRLGITCSNIVISALRKVIPSKVRIPAYIVVIASFVTIVQMIVKAFVPALDAALGVYLPLIVVNCIILGRAEAYASKNPVLASAIDGIGMGIGFLYLHSQDSAQRQILFFESLHKLAPLQISSLTGSVFILSQPIRFCKPLIFQSTHDKIVKKK